MQKVRLSIAIIIDNNIIIDYVVYIIIYASTGAS